MRRGDDGRRRRTCLEMRRLESCAAEDAAVTEREMHVAMLFLIDISWGVRVSKECMSARRRWRRWWSERKLERGRNTALLLAHLRNLRSRFRGGEKNKKVDSGRECVEWGAAATIPLTTPLEKSIASAPKEQRRRKKKMSSSSSSSSSSLSMERCLEEFKGVLTGALPTVDCLKFGVSKGLVRRDTERRGRVRAVLRDDELISQPPFFSLCV